MSAYEDKVFRILIVDDEPSDIQLIAKILDKNKYNVSYAKDGNTAIQMVQRAIFDLILLDIVMPGMNGFDVCKYLKEDRDTKDIPVIFLTAKTEIENVIKGFKLGGIDYVTKPFIDLELFARIENHLELKSKHDTLEAELTFRENVLTETALYITRRNELSKSIIKELEYLNKKTNLKYKELVQDIIRKLKSLIEGQEEKELDIHMNKAHRDFQQKLYNAYPYLTPNEMKLCTFLRLNMATKEIAEITNQSIHALEAARSRLRKKLKLSQSTNLVNFLHQF